MLSIIGFLTVVIVVTLLLSGRVTPIVALIMVPIVGAVLAGFGFQEIGEFFSQGLAKVMSIAVMFIFAILYFGLMQDVGLFDPIIKHMIKWSGGNVIAITIGTVIIAAIAHLDGSGASTFLITIPALLPLYHRLNMSPYLLLLLIGASASVMNMVPWGGPLGRVASVLEVDPSILWQPLIPLQVVALFVLIGMAIILGIREKKRIHTKKIGNSEQEEPSKINPFNISPNVEFKKGNQPQKLWFNFMLTVILIAILMVGIIPSALVFMIGVSIALTINYPNMKLQLERIKAHAPSAMLMACVIIAAGVFLGVLKGTGMLDALAINLVDILPLSVVPYLHIIIGFLGVPFDLLLSTDAYYFALFPVVEQIVSNYGVSSEAAAYAMIIGNILGTFVSPFSAALWLALGLAGLEMGKHILYSFFWTWGFSVVIFFIAIAIGIV